MRRGEDSFASRARAGLGPTVAEEFYLPYARKLFGVDPAELDRSCSGAASGHARRRDPAPVSPATRHLFYYPAGGFGHIPDAFADAAVRPAPCSGRGRSRRNRAPTGRGARRAVNGAIVKGRGVLSTIPAGVAAGVYDPVHLLPTCRRR